MHSPRQVPYGDLQFVDENGVIILESRAKPRDSLSKGSAKARGAHSSRAQVGWWPASRCENYVHSNRQTHRNPYSSQVENERETARSHKTERTSCA